NAVWFLCLFFSGATLPFSMLPNWVQQFSLFLPATYLVLGLEDVILGHATTSNIWPHMIALFGGLSWAFFLSVQIFRWEPEAKVTRRAKWLALATVVPFLLLGAWEMKYGNLRKNALSNFNMTSRAPQSSDAPSTDHK